MENTKKIAVFFPGIGYTCDKPLLYYSAKLAAAKGFEIRQVPYGNFPPNVKGDAAKMYQCFVSAREQTEDILRDVEWEQYSEIVFFSKSVGTVVALSYAAEHGLGARQVLFTARGDVPLSGGRGQRDRFPWHRRSVGQDRGDRADLRGEAGPAVPDA